jgi:hypothetical protein
MSKTTYQNTECVDGSAAQQAAFSFQFNSINQRLANLEHLMMEVHEVILAQRIEKEWYTTTELADALGKSQYTIQERWCNEGRIECEKNPESDKWRIPGYEFRRLVRGGELKPKRK